MTGWGSNDTPFIVANSSSENVRIPGNMKGHSVALHPSPTLRTAVGWRSPVHSAVHIEGIVQPAHAECGNGITWSLMLRRGAIRQQLAAGVAHGPAEIKLGPFDGVAVQPGDVLSISIGSRDGDHSCDLTAVELQVTDESDKQHTWNLAQDVSDDVQAGNPHADRLGNANVWCFYTEPDVAGPTAPVVPPGSLVAKWLAAKTSGERRQLALDVQTLLTGGPPAAKDTPDSALYHQLASLRGPLLANAKDQSAESKPEDSNETEVGLDPAIFGHHPNGRAIASENLCVHAPSVIEIRVPADLAAGYELVTTGVLDNETAREGSVQLSVAAGKPPQTAGLVRGEPLTVPKTGPWSGNKSEIVNSAPILVTEGSATQKRMQAAFEEFRQLFPPALCYTKIVPVDEVISVTLFYREDDHLVRLMLDDAQRQQLDRLWDELHFVSRDALTSVDAFAQLMEFATQDADPESVRAVAKADQRSGGRISATADRLRAEAASTR